MVYYIVNDDAVYIEKNIKYVYIYIYINLHRYHPKSAFSNADKYNIKQQHGHDILNNKSMPIKSWQHK